MSHGNDTTYKLDELAERAGVSPRTVRYYVQRGLLPAPVFRGRDTAYSEDHLVRLRAIRRLQDRFLPLDAIQVELERRSSDELRDLAQGRDRDSRAVNMSVVPVAPPVPRHPSRAPSGRPRAGAHGERWERWVLAPGVELHVSEGAGAEARALADELRSRAERHQRDGGSKR